jgi:hypothetical protein
VSSWFNDERALETGASAIPRKAEHQLAFLRRLRGAIAAMENEQLFWFQCYYRVGLAVCIREFH